MQVNTSAAGVDTKAEREKAEKGWKFVDDGGRTEGDELEEVDISASRPPGDMNEELERKCKTSLEEKFGKLASVGAEKLTMYEDITKNYEHMLAERSDGKLRLEDGYLTKTSINGRPWISQSWADYLAHPFPASAMSFLPPSPSRCLTYNSAFFMYVLHTDPHQLNIYRPLLDRSFISTFRPTLTEMDVDRDLGSVKGGCTYLIYAPEEAWMVEELMALFKAVGIPYGGYTSYGKGRKNTHQTRFPNVSWGEFVQTVCRVLKITYKEFVFHAIYLKEDWMHDSLGYSLETGMNMSMQLTDSRFGGNKRKFDKFTYWAKATHEEMVDLWKSVLDKVAPNDVGSDSRTVILPRSLSTLTDTSRPAIREFWAEVKLMTNVPLHPMTIAAFFHGHHRRREAQDLYKKYPIPKSAFLTGLPDCFLPKTERVEAAEAKKDLQALRADLVQQGSKAAIRKGGPRGDSTATKGPRNGETAAEFKSRMKDGAEFDVKAEEQGDGQKGTPTPSGPTKRRKLDKQDDKAVPNELAEASSSVSSATGGSVGGSGRGQNGRGERGGRGGRGRGGRGRGGRGGGVVSEGLVFKRGGKFE